MNQDRSRASLWFSILVIAMLAVGAWLPWMEYEQSSGRNTEPDGPYGEEKMVDYQFHTVKLYASEGDLTPKDHDLVGFSILGAMGLGALCLLVAALGDMSAKRNIVPRNASLWLQVFAWLSIGGAIGMGWYWLPETLGAYGVHHPFTYFLEEPDGYTRTTISYGWLVTGLAFLTVPIAWVQKFQAGSDDPTDVEAYRV